MEVYASPSKSSVKFHILKNDLKEKTVDPILRVIFPILEKGNALLEKIHSLVSYIFATLLDFVFLPVFGAMALAGYIYKELTPSIPGNLQGKTPILLLHGTNFNQVGWGVGKKFLRRHPETVVFSLNHDGAFTNDATKGIDDYAKGKITEAIREIKTLTGRNDLILIGHSMGGLIAGYYAENLAEQEGVKVKHVISIATPWKGTPILNLYSKIHAHFPFINRKRFDQMSLAGGTPTDPHFRTQLVNAALTSEHVGRRKYYNVYSEGDLFVPGKRGLLTQDSKRQFHSKRLGHLTILIWPTIWKQVNTWLETILSEEREEKEKLPSI